jgi:hypothetical protein
MPDNNGQSWSVTSRRSFLSKASATLVAAGTVGTANVGAVNNSGLDRVQIALGSVNSPVKQETCENLRQKALQAYREDGGQNASAGRAIQDGEDAPLVGFAVAYDNAGVPQYLTAKTADPARVEKQQQQLKERTRSIQKEIQATNIAPREVLQQDDNPTWKQELGITAGGGVNTDAGSIEHDIEVFHLNNDGVSDGENFAIVQTMTREPETYTNLNGRTTQDWQKAKNSPGVESNALIDYAPQNKVAGDGSKTKDYSARGVEKDFSWEHDGDVTQENRTDAQDADQHIAEFYQTQAGAASDKDQEMGCASVVEVTEADDGFLDIAKVDAEGKFFLSAGQVYDSVKVTDSQTINIAFSLL